MERSVSFLDGNDDHKEDDDDGGYDDEDDGIGDLGQWPWCWWA